MPFRRLLLAMAILGPAGLLAPGLSDPAIRTAALPPSARAGMAVAERACGGCHPLDGARAIASAGIEAAGGAVPLLAIARNDPALVEGVLLRPTWPMRAIALQPAEADALRAYVRWLSQSTH